MHRIVEAFTNLPPGAQYVADPGAIAVGRIVNDSGINELDWHPAYRRHAAYFEMEVAGREPSSDLSSDMPGRAINAKIEFRRYSGTAGVVMDINFKLTPGQPDVARLGYDGQAWYYYVCAPSRIVAASLWKTVMPLDDKYHRFMTAIRHNRIVGQFDDLPPFTIPYSVATWAPAGTQTASVLLESSAAWGIRYRYVDLGLQN